MKSITVLSTGGCLDVSDVCESPLQLRRRRCGGDEQRPVPIVQRLRLDEVLMMVEYVVGSRKAVSDVQHAVNTLVVVLVMSPDTKVTRFSRKRALTATRIPI